uniref:iron-sulfur cluster assembly protein n=2 Tax=Sphingomonas sp. GlSt437 TaxID=3389970 RepID=UPI003A875AE9
MPPHAFNFSPPSPMARVEQRRDTAGDTNAESLDAAIATILDRIHDPCSIAAGRPLSVLAMGLVRGWQLADGALTVTFAVTFPGCTMAPHFIEAAREALVQLPGVERVQTVVDTDYVWTPADMPAPANLRGVPQAWRSHRPG